MHLPCSGLCLSCHIRWPHIVCDLATSLGVEVNWLLFEDGVPRIATSFWAGVGAVLLFLFSGRFCWRWFGVVGPEAGRARSQLGSDMRCMLKAGTAKVALPWRASIQIVWNIRWCCWGGLNSRPHPYQGCALPLSYSSVTVARCLGPNFAMCKRNLDPFLCLM